ncbi:hypothetical protein [Otoolea muris]|uniref:hypothetical protein n=1 Tax=Otoolea muris TaxID=2941515 RepID=UPI00203E71BA|nr:hypothetical protein [Otoolea muris]
MLSNAIAEMRTYGEGFIIADQSPGAVDISAIRNTNTKIIMRLPDEQDRRLSGKSAGLKDSQLDEIAKLPRGVAVVYQNDWIKPVLCRIEKFRGEEGAYRRKTSIVPDSSGEQKKILIKNLLNKATGEKLDMTIGELTDILTGMNILTETKVKALRALRVHGDCSLSEVSPVIYDLVCTSSAEKEADAAGSVEEWRDAFVYANDSILAGLDRIAQNTVLECILREQIERYGRPAEYLETWRRFLKEEVM